MIRETLYEDQPTLRRARLHRRIAEAIEAVNGQDGAAHVVELAAHYRLAVSVATDGKAVFYARRAGDAAAAVFAWEEAKRHWQTALRLADPDDWSTGCELLLALGEAQNHIGERAQAEETFLKTAESARQLRLAAGKLTGDGVRHRAHAALAYRGPGVLLGTLDQAQVGLLEQALVAVADVAAVGDGFDPDRRGLPARLLARLALALFWTPRREESLRLSLSAVEEARRAPEPRALVAALHVRRYVLWGPEQLQERSGLAAEMVAPAEALGDAELTQQGLRWRVVDALERVDVVALDTAIARYEQLAEALHHPYHQWYATLYRATRAITSGRYAEGERLAEEAFAFGRRAGDPDATMFFTVQLAPARVQQGRGAELQAALRALAERYPTRAAYRSRFFALCAELGDVAEARRLLDEVASNTADPDAGEFACLARDGNWLVTMGNLARACVLLGDQPRAVRRYALLEPCAGRNAVSGAGISVPGPTSLRRGSLAALLGRTGEAAAHFEAALALTTRLEALPHVAITQQAYAALLLSLQPCSPVAEARALDMLASALTTAEALGMAPLEQEIRRTLSDHAADGSAQARRAGAARYPDGLSSREVEVLRLAAAGRSNREITEALTLSVVTVQNHIANIYRKADIRNRAEAATYAQRHGLNEPERA